MNGYKNIDDSLASCMACKNQKICKMAEKNDNLQSNIDLWTELDTACEDFLKIEVRCKYFQSKPDMYNWQWVQNSREKQAL